MAESVSLSALGKGASAKVRAYPSSSAGFLRFREMGLSPGARVTVVRAAPLGDPLEILVRGYRLTLRRAEADQIQVDPE